MAVQEALPHWDLTPFFSAPDSPEVDAGIEEVAGDIASLRELVDAGGLDSDFDGVVERLNELLEREHLLHAYLAAEVSVDSRNDVAQARLSRLMQESVGLANLQTRITAWLGAVDADELLGRSEQARAHESRLRRAQVQAQHLMAPAEEDLAAELARPGSSRLEQAARRRHVAVAWCTLELDGGDADAADERGAQPGLRPRPRDVRRRAYEAELAAWEGWAVPLAAALNRVKGAVDTSWPQRRELGVGARRGAVRQRRSTAPTLDAMLDRSARVVPRLPPLPARQGQRARARALAWYDMFAPVPAASGRVWSYGEAREFIVEQFGTYSAAHARLRRARLPRALDRRGAAARASATAPSACRLRGDESRDHGQLHSGLPRRSTLAHELGHGYHNINLADAHAASSAQTPMTLAETASIFCETICREAALREAEARRPSSSRSSKASLQEAARSWSTSSAASCSRAVYSRPRRERELSVDGALRPDARAAQRETYGDGARLDALTATCGR